MPTPKPPLYASFEKVKGAERKITELTTIINGFVQNTKRTVRVEPAEGLFYVIAGYASEPSAELGLKVGEIGSELRDALDKMTVSLAIKNERGPSGVGFPWGGLDKTTGKRQPYPDVRHRNIEQKLSPDMWSLLLAQKPHPGGNEALWAINQIANNHKHWEHLVDVRITPRGKRMSFDDGYIGKMIFSPNWPDSIVRQNETEQAIFAYSGNTTASTYGELSVHVVFGELYPLTGKQILPTLNEQIRLTESIVKLFRETFF
ncbi:MAG: hypothetical protein KDA53_08575 [Hyphomonas sp.]|nr:hypothetical protein [Hyphomonas sp.]